MPIELPGKIVDIKVIEGKILARIETDLLYPGGGGQPNDHAWVTQNHHTVFLTEVEEILGVPYWILPEPGFIPGEVTLSRDDLWRFELSQQHTAQHILSGLAFSHFGWPSNGFTIFPDTAKIEFVGADLDPDKYTLLENETNQVIYQGLPVEIYTLADQVRMVEIQGVDRCGCGGTHLTVTSQAGGFAILERERKNKESVRITFAAGLRLARIAKSFQSWKESLKKKLNGDIEERIEFLLKDFDQARETEKALLQVIISLVPPGDSLVRLDHLPVSPEAIKYMAMEWNRKGRSSYLTNQEGYFVLSGPESLPIWEDLQKQGVKGGGKGLITGRRNR